MQDKDFQWFIENYSALFSKYGTSYLAIKERAVIGVFHSYAEGVVETSKREPLGTFIIQECNGDESGYTNYISSVNFMS